MSTKSRNFNLLAHPTGYEVAKMLADREDAIKPFVPHVIPELEYPKVYFRPASLKAFLSQILP